MKNRKPNRKRSQIVKPDFQAQIQIANKWMNIFSTSLVIGKMQIQILMRYHSISIRLAEIIWTVEEPVEPQKMSWMLARVNIVPTTLEYVWHYLVEFRMHILHVSVVSFLGIYPREKKQ